MKKVIVHAADETFKAYRLVCGLLRVTPACLEAIVIEKGAFIDGVHYRYYIVNDRRRLPLLKIEYDHARNALTERYRFREAHRLSMLGYADD